MSRSWLAGGLDQDAAASYARLAAALANLSDRGEILPCQHPGRWWLWTSADRDEREAAAHMCSTCPLLATCAAHAPYEAHGVWAGVDRTPKQRTPPPGGPGCANP